MPKLALTDLSRELRDWERRFPQLKDDARFVAWFMRAYVTDDEQSAVDSITGASRDKGTDAALLEENVSTVFLVQGKLRQTLMAKAEKREDVLHFASVAETLLGPEDAGGNIPRSWPRRPAIDSRKHGTDYLSDGISSIYAM